MNKQYEPFDQDRWLSKPPWTPDDEALLAWEKAHGHDVRLKCYVEFGCQVIEPYYERQIMRYQDALEYIKLHYPPYSDAYMICDRVLKGGQAIEAGEEDD